MAHVCSFPPLAAHNARLLILGSMPGIASLDAQQYYAHPQNQFWKILGSVLGFDPAGSYASRVQSVTEAGIAVWDVLESCVREGSLDTAIDKTSAVPNDFIAFFASHPAIRRVCFNGTAAESLFMRQVQPHLPLSLTLQYARLPSTSPANAAIRLGDKLAVWSAALRQD
ncbi:DNA-deoxyinosine glycosylase [Uliginosibacterium sp. H3]|uniref:DNA-deoxyinosine glycosylase n=1 Tax=Uliginosibacterium silvisoli TaxID=3114758 RepID=A0ABU6K4K7_9RHOO|nr:DNA-deoxyinosine glycosylase [Uliginosibacterium sp. H3]